MRATSYLLKSKFKILFVYQQWFQNIGYTFFKKLKN